MKQVVGPAHLKFSYVTERDDDGKAIKCVVEEFHEVELVLYDTRKKDGVYEVRILGDVTEEDGDATSEQNEAVDKNLDEDDERS